MSENLQQTLTLRERELDLVLSIGALRDGLEMDDPPETFLEHVLALLCAALGVDAAALFLWEEGQQNSVHKAVREIDVEQARRLCQQAAQHTDMDVMGGHGWAAGVGLPMRPSVALVGGMVLLREGNLGFSQADYQMLQTAKRQIEAAVVQVRRNWQLAQRQQELDAIYDIDQLRDSTPDENELINGFSSRVANLFGAQVCLMILSDIDSGQMTTRSLIDRVGLPPAVYNTILQAVDGLHETENIRSPQEGLHLLASPFIVAEMYLGSVIVGRETPFGERDRRLLHALSSQMDSAIVHSRVVQQLAQRSKELQMIYSIDRIRDSDTDFDGMLQAILGELCGAIEADIGFILLLNEDEEDQLELRSVSQGADVDMNDYHATMQAAARRALDSAEMIYENTPDGDIDSVVAAPLRLRDQVIGVFGGANSQHPQGFTAENRRMLKAITSQVDTAIFERLEQRRVRQVLGRSVDPKVLEHLLEYGDPKKILAGERMNISVLFADLRGSTEWAERTEPDQVAYVLNTYLGRMTDTIFEFGGTLDKFVGDEVVAIFGAPLPMDNHAAWAAGAGLEMQRRMAELQRELTAEGYELPNMGVGISTGDAICGEFGTSQRTDYTAMGRMMNLGARLCSAAAGGEVVVSEVTYQRTQQQITAERLGEVRLRGIGRTTVYKVQSISL